MPDESALAFSDNWAYLKFELSWLDRILRQAVAKQQQETKEIDRVAKTKGDRATSFWWKGLISIDRPIGRDDGKPPAPSTAPPLTYQQQLEARIEASYRQGITLGLPSLRDRIELTVFEKNLVLMSLAPEINRRFSKLYAYLQGDEQTNLPTVDLVLKLLCRGDEQWREARIRLTSTSPLTQLGLVQFLSSRSETLLSSRVKLSEDLVNYLLADRPQVEVLETLLAKQRQFLLKPFTPIKTWSDLVLPAKLLANLQQLSQQWQLQAQVDEVWGFNQKAVPTGTIALCVGIAGTGKTSAAEAIASALDLALVQVDLALVDSSEYSQLLAEIASTSPTLLLMKSAQFWLSRTSDFSLVELSQFFYQRQQQHCITLLSVSRRQMVRPSLMGLFDLILEFPLPNRRDRLRLWQQAFPDRVPLDPDLDWEYLAQWEKISGSDIEAIARQAAFLAAAESSSIQLQHLIQALEQKIGRRKLTASQRQRRSPQRN